MRLVGQESPSITAADLPHWVVNLHQLEADRHIQLYPDFFAILAAGVPVGHGADNPQGLFVASAADTLVVRSFQLRTVPVVRILQLRTLSRATQKPIRQKTC